jgi:hypothetical protein
VPDSGPSSTAPALDSASSALTLDTSSAARAAGRFAGWPETTSSAPTTLLPPTDSAIGSERIVWYAFFAGSKYENASAGISVAGPVTCATTLNVFVVLSSDNSPVGGSAGTVNLSFGRRPSPSSRPSASVSSRWLLFTLMSSSTGSPSLTTERLARTSSANCSPTAPANVGGRPVSGSARTSSVRGASLARNMRDGALPKKSARPTGSGASTVVGGISSLPTVRGVTKNVDVSRLYSTPPSATVSTVYASARSFCPPVSGSAFRGSGGGGTVTVSASCPSSGALNVGFCAGWRRNSHTSFTGRSSPT